MHTWYCQPLKATNPPASSALNRKLFTNLQAVLLEGLSERIPLLKLQLGQVKQARQATLLLLLLLLRCTAARALLPCNDIL